MLLKTIVAATLVAGSAALSAAGTPALWWTDDPARPKGDCTSEPYYGVLVDPRVVDPPTYDVIPCPDDIVTPDEPIIDEPAPKGDLEPYNL